MERKYHTVAMTRFPGDTATPKHESNASLEICKKKKMIQQEKNKDHTEKEIETKKDSNNIRRLNCHEAYQKRELLHQDDSHAKSSSALNYPINI